MIVLLIASAHKSLLMHHAASSQNDIEISFLDFKLATTTTTTTTTSR